MSLAAVLLLGVGLGLRHAADPDHVVVVTALARQERSPWRAARIAAWWAAGHSVAFFTIGALVLALGIRPSLRFEQITELAVATLLLSLGAWQLRAVYQARDVAATGAGRGALRPALAGLVHGSAGSSGVALLASASIPSPLATWLYLGVFGVGTVLGMVALTLVLMRPLRWSLDRPRAHRAITMGAALLSVGLGLTYLLRALQLN